MPKRNRKTSVSTPVRKLRKTLDSHPEGIKESGKFVPWPTLNEEEARHSVWIDEAGMGSWAGPLYVAGTYLKPDFDLKGIHDSKLLKVWEREQLFEDLKVSNDIIYHVEQISNSELDELGGLGPAWEEAVRRVVGALKIKVPEVKTVYLDGNKHVECDDVEIIPVTKGDRLHVGIGAASIFAKVTRDRYMQSISSNYPEEWYNIFAKGKGYWFSHDHTNMVKAGNYTDLHRKTYNPLKTYLQQQKESQTE